MTVSQFTNIVDPRYIRAQVVLQGATGLPDDQYVNTFTFVCSDGEDYLDQIEATLQNAYDEVTEFYSSEVSRSGALIKFYDLEIAPPNVPLDTRALTINAKASGAADLPSEVALCVSFKGPAVAGQNPARSRGRVYLGPWAFAGVTDWSRPDSGMIAVAVAFGDAIMTGCGFADAIACWAVLSPTNAGGWLIPGESGPPNFAAAVVPAFDGWVDNAWDTQRRRGLAPTSRTTFS